MSPLSPTSLTALDSPNPLNVPESPPSVSNPPRCSRCHLQQPLGGDNGDAPAQGTEEFQGAPDAIGHQVAAVPHRGGLGATQHPQGHQQCWGGHQTCEQHLGTVGTYWGHTEDNPECH